MIAHVDINAYFATMLQQENPALRGKPVGVLKGAKRSCVIASSKEAKKRGVQTGCRAADAKKLCPDIVFVPAAFDLYLSNTHRLKAIFTSLCPNVQVFSLDEAFLDITDCDRLYPDPEAFGLLVQERVRAVLGEWVTCNVGIADTKLMAKMASEVGEKGSVSVVHPEDVDRLLMTTEFKDVCGVGYRLEEKLKLLGVTTPYAINLIDDETLRSRFGPFWAEELRKIGRGEETHFFTHQKLVPHMQSVGRSITGYGLCDDEAVIKHTIRNLLEEAALKMRRMHLLGRSFGVSLSGRGKNGEHLHWGKQIRLGQYLKHTSEMFELIYDGAYCSWHRTFPILKFGVWIGELKPEADVPLCLLPSWEKQDKITTVSDAINERFGGFTIRPATLIRQRLIKPEVTGFLGDKTYYQL